MFPCQSFPSMTTVKQAGTQVAFQGSDISILFYACHPFPRVLDMESRLFGTLKCVLSACLSGRKCLSSENNEHYSLCLISVIPLSTFAFFGFCPLSL